MQWSIHSSRVSLLVVGVLLVLLAALASLQYRWIAQLSEAERARLQEGLDRAAASFSEDFDREIARAFAVFWVEPGRTEALPELLAEDLGAWRSTARWPALVKDLFIVRYSEGKEVELLRLHEQSQTLVRCSWGDELRPIRRSLSGPGPGLPVLDGVLPGLVLAIDKHSRPESDTPIQWRPPRDHLVVRFDLSVIAETIFPTLAENHFGSSDNHGCLLRVSLDNRPEDAIFRRGSPASSRARKPDASARLFGLRSFSDLSPSSHGEFMPRRPPPPRRGQRHGAGDGPRGPAPPDMRARSEEGRWSLIVHHAEGSLESVVAKVRRRNMAISLVILGMLGITTVLLLLSTRNARRLARQQMDFVAAVSHELRTPLTAIRSAGQNLADGIIAEPERVRDYGLLIEREGRRLTEMIGRVLTFAGIRSGRQTFRMGPVELANIVEAALADCRWTLDENGFEVDSNIAPDLPPVQGDGGALRLVCSNLIDNAIKYGAAGRWLGVTVNFDRKEEPREIWISVSDHGPGIPRRERQRLFDPFRRGADAASGTVPGSGLGLAVVRGVVEAHGGSIDVSSNSGSGTTFTVRLPVARRDSDQEDSRNAG